MTTSGSADLVSSGSAIASAAYRIVYNVSSEYTLEAAELADFLEALNGLVKNLMGPPSYICKGMKTWQRKVATLPLATKLEYLLQPSGGDLAIFIPVKILGVTLKHNNSESPLKEMSYEDYFYIENKTLTGTPSRYNYERNLDEGKLRLNCIPTSKHISDEDSLVISYLTPLEDFDSQIDEPFFPQEWFRPLKWMLAIEMSPEAGKRVPEDIAALASQSMESANRFDVKETNMYFEPDNPENW